MGGDAFQSTERLSEEDYVRKCEEIKLLLGTAGVNFGFPAEVSDKQAICKERGKDKPYGDVDVIIAVEDHRRRTEIVKLLKTSVGLEGGDVLRNDTTYSFLSKERFQIDLQFCKQENLAFILAYQSNNDFGALLGHLLTPLRLKWSKLGLALKLKIPNVSGVGTCKAELVLTKDLSVVCSFLALPGHSLDGKTRMSTTEIFEVLTRTRVFFLTDYDVKYKIRERRKRRPVSDCFFNLLESNQNDLEEQKRNLLKNDEVEMLFRNFRNKMIQYEEYISLISEHFNKKDEVLERLASLKECANSKHAPNPKFNFQILCSWCPDMEQNIVGRILAKIKSKHSGIGKDAFEEWINVTEIEDIKSEVDIIKCIFQ
eukprot:GFUD01129581.1.p1 GENE.GFUD01129581.1~~GFUD01129581.1.p1  ORF type:complete len:370 (+),score=89.16 GFUD01129581.1:62-1171(+)